MQLNPFMLEEYYGKYEFVVKYMLSSSDAESWTLPEILQMANQQEQDLWHNQRFGYTEIKGMPTLREQIAHSLYPGLDADNILCFAGAEDGIFCTLLALCNKDDHIIVLTPCYQSLFEIPRIAGCNITSIELKQENEWKIDIGAIEDAIKTTTKGVVINFPHNPTGSTITQAELDALIVILAKRNIWLFSDEVYLYLGPKETTWATPAACAYSNGISLNVMSKAYGLPGLRIGWIACQNKGILQQIERIKQYTSLCNSSPSELLSIIALHNKDLILNRNQGILEHNLMLLDAFFARHADTFSWVRPQGACTGFVRYHRDEQTDQFCARIATQANILLLPGSVYNVSSNHFRIGFGRKNMPEVLELFEKSIQ
jgi:aspartate/methionine/tyrosine aminotransferase